MVTLGRWLNCEFAVCVAESVWAGREMSGGFVRKGGWRAGKCNCSGDRGGEWVLFPGGMNLGGLQLLVILCKYQLYITCAFVQRFLDTSLLSGNCALFGVTGRGLSWAGSTGWCHLSKRCTGASFLCRVYNPAVCLSVTNPTYLSQAMLCKLGASRLFSWSQIPKSSGFSFCVCLVFFLFSPIAAPVREQLESFWISTVSSDGGIAFLEERAHAVPVGASGSSWPFGVSVFKQCGSQR